MNEFTKDELQDIFDCLYYENKESEEKYYEKLLDKIESMIDKCFEHQPINNKLLISPLKVPCKNEWDIIFRWDGLKGERKMLLEINNDGFSLPREGVEDIKRMCQEFLNNEDRASQFLQVGK